MHTEYHSYTIEHDGLKFKVAYHYDESMGEPWKENDGHGIVSEWVTRDPNRGEVIIAREGNHRRYYDILATIEKAKAEEWGPQIEGKTPEDSAVAAVDQDLAYCKSWCDDEWHWAGVTVELLDTDGETVPDDNARESLWGIESSDDKLMSDEALDMAEIIARRFAGKNTVEIKIR